MSVTTSEHWYIPWLKLQQHTVNTSWDQHTRFWKSSLRQQSFDIALSSFGNTHLTETLDTPKNIMGYNNTLPSPPSSSGPVFDISHQDLHDIELNDDPTKPPRPPRRVRIKHILHQILFLLFYAFPDATFAFLRRCATCLSPNPHPQPNLDGLANTPALDGQISNPLRVSTSATERVIWLVCEDCGCSKRMVDKKVGDPVRYFYDDEKGVEHKLEEASNITSTTSLASVRKYPLTKDRNAYRSVCG